MAHPPKTVLLCSCEKTMHVDAAAIGRVCRNSEIKTFDRLCRAALKTLRAGIGDPE